LAYVGKVENLMRQIAKARGDARKPFELELEAIWWTLHDIRRTVRTHLSALPGVSDLVRELILAHARPDLHQVYDQYAYLEEKRDALALWAARLKSIVEPPTGNVVALRA
jgi:integrase